MEIFEEVIAALNGLLTHKAYAGTIGKKTAIAIPTSNGKYKLVTEKKAFIGHLGEKLEMSASEVQAIESLSVIS